LPAWKKRGVGFRPGGEKKKEGGIRVFQERKKKRKKKRKKREKDSASPDSSSARERGRFERISLGGKKKGEYQKGGKKKR